MIEITVYILLVGMLIFGIRMRRKVPKVLKHLYESDVKSTIIKTENLVNPKITEALEKGSKEQHDILLRHLNLVQIEKERLLKDDYIYSKIEIAVSKNEYYFMMSTDNNEITRDAINLIPGMKARINEFNRLAVTFPNRE